MRKPKKYITLPLVVIFFFPLVFQFFHMISHHDHFDFHHHHHDEGINHVHHDEICLVANFEFYTFDLSQEISSSHVDQSFKELVQNYPQNNLTTFNGFSFSLRAPPEFS